MSEMRRCQWKPCRRVPPTEHVSFRLFIMCFRCFCHRAERRINRHRGRVCSLAFCYLFNFSASPSVRIGFGELGICRLLRSLHKIAFFVPPVPASRAPITPSAAFLPHARSIESHFLHSAGARPDRSRRNRRPALRFSSSEFCTFAGKCSPSVSAHSVSPIIVKRKYFVSQNRPSWRGSNCAVDYHERHPQYALAVGERSGERAKGEKSCVCSAQKSTKCEPKGEPSAIRREECFAFSMRLNGNDLFLPLLRFAALALSRFASEIDRFAPKLAIESADSERRS